MDQDDGVLVDLAWVLKKEMIDTIQDLSDKHYETAIVGGNCASQVLHWVLFLFHASIVKISGKVLFLMLRVGGCIF